MGTLNALDKISPILLFGYGNPSRGDDALGPLLIEHMEQAALPHVNCLTDMQLQVEHVMDLEGRTRILFIDADVSCCAPYVLSPLQPEHDGSYTSHAMSPAALIHAYTKVYGVSAPPAYLLRIRGYDFALGQPVSAQALENLSQATLLINNLFSDLSEKNWQQHLSLTRQTHSAQAYQTANNCNYTLPTSIEKIEAK